MRALIVGSSDFKDAKRITRELDRLLLSAKARDRKTRWPLAIIVGRATGAASLAAEWAADSGVPCFQCFATWSFYGPQADEIRNEWVLAFARPDVVIAFENGPATAATIAHARAAGVRVVEIKTGKAA